METSGQTEASKQEEWRQHDARVLKKRQTGQRCFLLGLLIFFVAGTLDVWWGPFVFVAAVGVLMMPVGIWMMFRAGKTSEEARLAISARRNGEK